MGDSSSKEAKTAEELLLMRPSRLSSSLFFTFYGLFMARLACAWLFPACNPVRFL